MLDESASPLAHDQSARIGDAVPSVTAERIEEALTDILRTARRTCHDPGLRLQALVSRRQPHGIAVIFEFSSSERWMLARDFGHWSLVRSQATTCIRSWLAVRGQGAFLTIEPDVRSVPAAMGFSLQREEWANAAF